MEETPKKKARKPRKKPQSKSAKKVVEPPQTTDTEEPELSAKIRRSDDELIVVGIGASAGGLEALRGMLSALPTEANITYVIAQHLDPTHRSMLTTLLARFTSLEVVATEDNQPVEANHIFITPPGKDVTIVQGRLQLRQPTAAITPKPSIDQFFTSLAQDQGDKAVGVILSGTGSDGAHGMRAIKAEGGITIVQDEGTARYNGMPRAAIETGLIDLILSPERIGPELIEIIKHPHVVPLAAPELEPPDSLQTIFQMVLDKTGCDFSDYKLNTIRRRLDRRMAVHKLTRLDDYVRYLEHSSTEIDLLFKDILISVTSFFRDPETFQALDETIAKIVETKKPADSIRFWVPGCATGEEAYSIAILLAERLGDRLNSYNIQIFGTDIDVDAINRARKGVYPEAVTTDMDLALQERYFTRDRNTFLIKQSIREMVIFARQDMTRDPPFSNLDLVSCRNVLIYFNPTLQQRLLPIFHYVLRPGGYLFLGKSESIGHFDNLFTPVNRKGKIYRRRDTARPPEVHFGPARPAGLPVGPHRIKPAEKELRLKDVMNQAIAEAIGHPAVIIDDRLEIIYVRGDISSYLTLAPGNTDLNILTMARNEIRVDLRTLIHKATRERVPNRSHRLTLQGGDHVKFVTIQVSPVSTNSGVAGLTLVLFEEEIAGEEAGRESAAENGEIDPHMAELEHELRATKEHLHTTIEELETANEELQSLNEELQSANEELQSSNEELETANEELQSTNEELTTVNEELQMKSNELAIANADLENVLDKIEIDLVLVDQNLKVTRFTPSVSHIFALTPDDVGQVLTTVPCHLDLPNLRQDLLDVMAQEQPIDRDIETEDEVYALRLSPYYSEHDVVAGAVLRFLDLTEIKQTERALRESEEHFRFTLANSPIVIFNQDKALRYTWIHNPNPAFSAEDIIGKTDSDLLPPEGAAPLIEVKQRVLDTGERTREEVNTPIGDEIFTYDLTVEPLLDSNDNIIGVSCAALEITELKQTQKALQQARDELEQRVVERTAQLNEVNEELRREIDEREQAEQALRESDERFRVALQESPISIFNQDTELRYTWVYNSNPAFPPEVVVGKLDSDILPAEDAAQLTTVKRRVLETGTGAREVVTLTADDTTFFYDLTVEPLQDKSGDIIGITCAAMDITQLKEIEAALRVSEEKFAAILEAAPEAIVIVDGEGCIRLINQKAEEMFGYDRSELIGQSVDILLPERLREIHIKHRAGYMADPRTRPMGLGLDLVARHKDGSEFPVVIGLNATETKDGTLIISSITNISDDRKPEPAADK